MTNIGEVGRRSADALVLLRIINRRRADHQHAHTQRSTAVPGLAAKPVIDMITIVPDIDAPIASLVEKAGYQFPRAYN